MAFADSCEDKPARAARKIPRTTQPPELAGRSRRVALGGFRRAQPNEQPIAMGSPGAPQRRWEGERQRPMATARPKAAEGTPTPNGAAGLAALPRPAGTPVPVALCGGCAHADRCFLGQTATRLREIRQIAFYPRGVSLFLEGEATRGLFVVCSGEIKTFAHSPQGGTVILRRVGGGEVLGMSSSLLGSLYPVSAETLVPSQISFLPRRQLLDFLAENPDCYRMGSESLAAQLQTSWEHARMLALGRHVVSRLAALLLRRAAEHGRIAAQGTIVTFPCTQEDLAESIGTTRETVSRILGDLRRQGILQRRGNGFLLMKPRLLEELQGL